MSEINVHIPNPSNHTEILRDILSLYIERYRERERGVGEGEVETIVNVGP